MQIVYVEDDDQVRRSIARMLGTITGLSVYAAGSLTAFRALELGRGKAVLVTDGDVGDADCGSVIAHALTIYTPQDMGGTVLLLSGDEPPIWEPQLRVAVEAGLSVERLTKPVTSDELREWWARVRPRF